MSKDLALPDPQTLAAGQVPGLVKQVTRLRRWYLSENDLAGADDLRRKLAAYERYVADKAARSSLEAESRRTEMLIGELLGPAENRGPATVSSSYGSITRSDRLLFRTLAGNPLIVESQLATGITARAKILIAIERARLATQGADLESGTRIGDFREVLADLPDESVDMIFTDPPYNKAAVELYGDLAEFGARVLKPGASLMAYCGQYALPQILVDMEGSLRFWWLCACVHDGGNHKSLPGIKTYVLWKPIVWFVKETNWAADFVFDSISRPAPAKTSHDWEQSLAEPLHYIEKLCPPGGLVVDPFAGGGTTRIATEQLGRRFIGAELNPEQQAIAAGRTA